MVLKTITFNMCHGKGMDSIVNIERQAIMLKKYKPDIVFLQEIDMYTKRSLYDNQISSFSDKIGLNYSSMGTNITCEQGFYGDGIISRFPITFSANYLMPLTDLKHEQRGILRNKISFGTTKINIFSMHFSTYGEERVLASKELLNIISKINQDEIIIIGGDFNVGVSRLGPGKYIHQALDNYEEYEILKTKLNKIDNTEPTWVLKEQAGCIDTFFYSPSIELNKYETIKTSLSDHSAIYAEFNI